MLCRTLEGSAAEFCWSQKKNLGTSYSSKKICHQKSVMPEGWHCLKLEILFSLILSDRFTDCWLLQIKLLYSQTLECRAVVVLLHGGTGRLLPSFSYVCYNWYSELQRSSSTDFCLCCNKRQKQKFRLRKHKKKKLSWITIWQKSKVLKKYWRHNLLKQRQNSNYIDCTSVFENFYLFQKKHLNLNSQPLQHRKIIYYYLWRRKDS